MEGSRKDFIRAVKEGKGTVSELCRELGISRKTGYKWLRRFEDGEELGDRSRAPFHKPNKTPGETEELIVALRERYPAWGGRKIRHVLEMQGYQDLPAASTICNILKRKGLISLEESVRHRPFQQFEMQHPNELWQADFKGNFGMANRIRCHPLTVLDDCTRYSLCVDAKDNQRYHGVRESFERMFREFGLPEKLLCDNGNPWGASQSTGYTQFEVWLMELGILTIHGRPGHPQTQGKEERFHRTMEEELLKHVEIKDLADAQRQFDAFRLCYNTQRPHQALDYDTPEQHYRPSSRRMPERIIKWEYESGCVVRQVKASGYLTYHGQGYFLSESFGEKHVAVRESEENGCVDIFFRGFMIGRIDIEERAVISRKIRRRDG